jgi:soluble lytic murein transglycosylase-like protein
MNKIKSKLFFLITLLMCNVCFSDPLDSFVDSLSEQSKAVSWVQTTTKGRVNQAEALLIVGETYAHSISREINPRIILAVMKVESNFQSNAKSNHGARGILQIIPYWHKDKLKGRNPFNIKVATEVGTTILQICLDKYSGDLFKGLNCYSGGGKQKYFNKVNTNKIDLVQALKPTGEALAFK